MMSHSYTSDEIDQIEKDFKNLDLEDEDVEIVEESIRIEIIESENDFEIDPEDIEIVKKPTKVKFIEND